MKSQFWFWALFFIFGFVISVVKEANAATPSCSTRFDELHYVADFDWLIPGKATRKMKIKIGALQPRRNAEPTLVAQLISQGSCEAVCRTKFFEREGVAPLALEMSCQSAKFDALSVPITLFWPETLGKKTAVLRFGTWIEGYRSAPLLVQLDRWTGLGGGKHKKLAQFQ